MCVCALCVKVQATSDTFSLSILFEIGTLACFCICQLASLVASEGPLFLPHLMVDAVIPDGHYGT